MGFFVRHDFHEPEHLLQCRGIDAMGLVLSYNIRHARYRRGIEESLDRQVPFKFWEHPRYPPRGGQRIPAEVEEIVVDADGIDGENLCPNFCKEPFNVRPWRNVGAVQIGP